MNKPSTIIDESTTVIVSSPVEESNPLVLKRINKLIGQKSIQVAKEEAMDASATINEQDLDEILSKDDKRFYQVKRQAYLTSYPDLADDQFDLDVLHLMIMEQIAQRQLYKKKKKHPAIDIQEDYERSTKRQGEYMKNLNVRRTDRMKTKDNKKVENNIANISMHFGNDDQVNAMAKRTAEMALEETVLEERKLVD